MHRDCFQKNKMYKSKRLKILAIILGVLIMSTVGCGRIIGYEELAEKLLNEKYHDEFVVENVQSTNVFSKSYTAIAYQKEHPEMLFKAYVENDGSGISDNYVARLVCEKLSDAVARNLDSLNGIYYIYSTTLIDSLELDDPKISLNEYIETNPDMPYYLYVFFSPDSLDKENLYQGLSNICQGLPISGNLYLHILDEIDLKTVQSYCETHDKIYDGGENLFESYYCGRIEFINGALESTKEEVFEMIEGK